MVIGTTTLSSHALFALLRCAGASNAGHAASAPCTWSAHRLAVATCRFACQPVRRCSVTRCLNENQSPANEHKTPVSGRCQLAAAAPFCQGVCPRQLNFLNCSAESSRCTAPCRCPIVSDALCIHPHVCRLPILQACASPSSRTLHTCMRIGTVLTATISSIPCNASLLPQLSTTLHSSLTAVHAEVAACAVLAK